MPFSWNEIKTRAAAFVLDWKGNYAVNEKAKAQTFRTCFLKIFSVDRKKFALFEHEMHFGDGQAQLFDQISSVERGYIDLIWKVHIIIEMKTHGKDFDKAYEQAKVYALELTARNAKFVEKIPKVILFEICDIISGFTEIEETEY